MKKTLITLSLATMGLAPALADAPMVPETWHDAGEGLIRDDLLTHFFYIDDFYEFTAKFMESDQVPGRYKVINAYANHPWGSNAALIDHEHSFIVDASDPDHVFIEKGCLGMNHYTEKDYWEFSIWSVADHEYNDKYGNWEDVEDNAGKVWGEMRDGAITFPKGQVLVYCYVPDDPDHPEKGFVHPDGGEPANERGGFRIKIPGAPNYDISAWYEGAKGSFPDISLCFNVGIGSDVDHVRYDYAPKGEEAKLAETLMSGGGEVADASEAMFGSLGVALPYRADGAFTFVAVPFSADGTPRAYASVDFTAAFDESQWKKFGETTWTEGLLSDCEYNAYEYLQLEHEVLPCEIEVNTTERNRMRLVNPLKNHSYASRQTYDYSKDYYIELVMLDPNHIYIDRSDALGLNLAFGDHTLWSVAHRYLTDYGYTVEAVDVVDPTFGKLDTATGEITFPNQSLLLVYGAAPVITYRANMTGAFKVNIPAEVTDYMLSGVETPVADAENAPVEIYTLSGMRVANTDAPGTYIMRKGNETRKIEVK